ncbi:MAG: glycoside hydrolase family 88 protein [Bacteroidales bacterium]|nr:glycoside hydrolase family 88 protein [Bacteroidales bacterium]
MRKEYILLLLFLLSGCRSKSTDQSAAVKNNDRWAVRMANSVMANSDSLIHYLNPPTVKWQYDVAFLGQAIDKLGDIDPRYSKYMEDYMDWFIHDDGSVYDYKIEEYNLDRVNPAKNIITIYKRTGDSVYRAALDQFLAQMETHPKTKTGGFWHKKIYPWQMWLDGIYMASPFLAQYANEFNDPEWFDVVAYQIELIYGKTLDNTTGLLYHAWDESREQRWCDPETGKSKYPWSRAMGWYTMAIVDALDYFPENHPERDSLISILQNTCKALLRVRDPKTGLWFQVLNQGDREGNYIEGSGSAMYTYVFAKGTHKGYLDAKFLDIANDAFDDLVKELITVDDQGLITMRNICGGCGLGGNPYRDGSYEYYINEKRVDNDPKGVAPFILAAIELGK